MAIQAGVSAGWAAASSTWAEGTWTQGNTALNAFFGQPSVYQTRRAWANNTIFEDPSLWQEARQLAGMYRGTRPLYNPVKRLCDFYAAAVYPGMLPVRGTKPPDGIQIAMPLDDAISEELRLALTQGWAWGAWGSLKTKLPRLAAIYGDGLVEIEDNLVRGKVYPRLVPAAQVADLRLNAQGAVQGYTQAYWSRDPDPPHKIYRYSKVVTADGVQTYRDEEPYGYDGMPAAYALPYGFVPAVWVRFKEGEDDDGSSKSHHGVPAADGSYNKIARLMALASHVHDQVHKAVGAPVVFWSDAPGGLGITPFGTAPTSRSSTQADDGGEDVTDADDESILILHGPQGGHAESLLGNLPLKEALALMQDLQTEIEADHPVLQVWKQLRGMTQITGPAASALLGDAWGPLNEAEQTMDPRVVQIQQMVIAIAGHRANAGDWGRALTAAQQRFLPFDLTSYDRGELDFSIIPRPLVAQTMQQLLTARAQEYQVLQAATDAGIPLKIAMQRAGWTDAEIAAVAAAQFAAEAEAVRVITAEGGQPAIREKFSATQLLPTGAPPATLPTTDTVPVAHPPAPIAPVPPTGVKP